METAQTFRETGHPKQTETLDKIGLGNWLPSFNGRFGGQAEKMLGEDGESMIFFILLRVHVPLYGVPLDRLLIKLNVNVN